MQTLEMVEQMIHQARAQGGRHWLSPPAPEAGMPHDADPRWRPAPDPTDGSLFQDPEFHLPTAAGPITCGIGRNVL